MRGLFRRGKSRKQHGDAILSEQQSELLAAELAALEHLGAAVREAKVHPIASPASSAPTATTTAITESIAPPPLQNRM